MYGRYIVLSQYNVRVYTIKDSSVVHTDAFQVRIQRTKLPKKFHPLARRHRRVKIPSHRRVIDESGDVRGGDVVATDRDEITSGAKTREVDDEGARDGKKRWDGTEDEATRRRATRARGRVRASERASDDDDDDDAWDSRERRGEDGGGGGETGRGGASDAASDGDDGARGGRRRSRTRTG